MTKPLLALLGAALLVAGCSTTPSSVQETPVTNFDPKVDRTYKFKGTGDDVAVIKTQFGTVIVEFDANAAPEHVQNFMNLAGQGAYNGTSFHRLVPGFIIQGGDPKSRDQTLRGEWGTGGPGYTMPPEIGLKNVRGAVGMARLGNEVNPGRESNGSQFYIVIQDAPSLDGQYTVFGRVIKGMEVVDAISGQTKDKNDVPLQRIDMTVEIVPRAQAFGQTIPSPAPPARKPVTDPAKPNPSLR